MKKLLIAACTVLALLLLMGSSVVLAAEPNNQACLGKDISGYAQGGDAFGHFVAGIAMNTQGIGDVIQAHLAGLVPDSVLPNSCND